jgi:subtilisin family serine protease
MGKKRKILVHTMRGAEAKSAQEILGGDSVLHGSTMVEGLADEDQIRRLQENDLVVEAIGEAESDIPAPPDLLFRAAAALDWSDVQKGGIPLSRSGRPVAVPSLTEMGTYVVRAIDPELSSATVLGTVGARMIRSLAAGRVVARLRPRQRVALEEDERVEVEPFNTSAARAPTRELTDEEREALAPSTGEERDFDLVAHSPDRLDEIETWVRSKGDALVRIGSAIDRVRIRVKDTSPLLDEADELDAVRGVQYQPATYLCLDRVRPLVGLPAATGPAHLVGPGGALDGKDEIIGIIDGAVDIDHPDLVGRVRTIYGPASPASAHGTHVAGIIVGDGSRSAGQMRGIAPAAELKAQALAVGDNGKIDLEVDFVAMLNRSYDAGARILNLSFEEDGPLSRYSDRTKRLDAFAVIRPDMLIVVAAGNRARTEEASWRKVGEVGIESISAPGVAKNVLTVGASCSDRTGGGHAATDWKGFAPQRFVSPPTSQGSLSGNASTLAAFSGRGWGQDERIKPDMVAPGTNIVAPRAAGTTDILWGVHSGDYLYGGGTSMAAPVVAGCAALVRQYFRQRGHSAPSSALLKATLANGTVWLTGADATPGQPTVPARPCANLDQGFGRVDVAKALGLGQPGETLCYVDVTAAGAAAHTLAVGSISPFTEDAQRRRFWFRCPPESAVSISLCYLDPEPGSAGAALFLQVQPENGGRRVGNDCAIKKAYPPFGLPPPDRVNTLQVVHLQGTGGKIVVQVSAVALQEHTVGFALVVRGPIEGGVLHAF